MADVTIRGIDDEVYARFTGEAKKRGISIGELTTIVMRALVDDPDVTDISDRGACKLERIKEGP